MLHSPNTVSSFMCANGRRERKLNWLLWSQRATSSGAYRSKEANPSLAIVDRCNDSAHGIRHCCDLTMAF